MIPVAALAAAFAETDCTLSTSEAAAMVGVTRPTFARYLDAGRIPYAQPGTHRKVKRSDVLAFIARTTHGQVAQ